MWEDYNEYLKGLWNDEPAVYVAEELQQTIKDHPGFSSTPIGPIGDYIISDQLRKTIPQSFAASYVVNCVEDSTILHQLVSAHGGLMPTIIIYPHQPKMYATVDENVTVNTVTIATLKCENPTIANLLIDYFGISKGM